MPSFALRPFATIAAVTALALLSFAGWLVGAAGGSRAAVPAASERSAAPDAGTIGVGHTPAATRTAATRTAARVATRASRSHRRDALSDRPRLRVWRKVHRWEMHVASVGGSC